MISKAQTCISSNPKLFDFTKSERSLMARDGLNISTIKMGLKIKHGYKSQVVQSEFK